MPPSKTRSHARARAAAAKLVQLLESDVAPRRAAAGLVRRQRSPAAATEARTLGKALAALHAALPEGALAAASGPEQATTFREFFLAVGSGLVDAQKQLDVRSREYLGSVASSQFLLPSVFRIPKLSAEMKFSLQNDGKEKFNVIFYGKESSSQSLNQQSVQFDVVSAPPPTPGLVAPLGYEPVFAPPARDALFASLRALNDQNVTKLLKDPPTVIVLVAESGTEFVLLSTDVGPDLAVASVLVEEGKLPTVVPLRAFGNPSAAIKRVAEKVQQQGLAQKAFLDKLGKGSL
jgi:hypothetical protein